MGLLDFIKILGIIATICIFAIAIVCVIIQGEEYKIYKLESGKEICCNSITGNGGTMNFNNCKDNLIYSSQVNVIRTGKKC